LTVVLDIVHIVLLRFTFFLQNTDSWLHAVICSTRFLDYWTW